MFKHLDYHENQFKNLTSLDLECLAIPKDFNVIGRHFNEQVIPVTAYRIGYNIQQILDVTNTDKRMTVLEIGGGFGLAGMIYKRNNKNSCYIIVDIETTAVLSAYLLIKLGFNVYLHGEEQDFNQQKLIEKYDVIILPPEMIEKLEDRSIDIVMNTASLPEMSKYYIKYYMTHIARLTNYFYYDNNLILNQPYLNEMCKQKLGDFDLMRKSETPLNFMYPSFCRYPLLNFEERL